jgi:CMP-N,N'-diacetyllegionaminic acid synthase
MSVLGFIPARGGSKGILHKNLVPLAGKPLIQYTVEAAQNSKYVDEIFISSEDDEIIGFCRSLGVEVPYLRPRQLAGDRTAMIDTVLHGLTWKQKKGLPLPDSVLILQPTSPLRESRHIDEAVEQFMLDGAESLISVNKMIENPYECVRVTQGGWTLLAKPAESVFRRQDYRDSFYYINGAIYLAKVRFLRRQRTFFIEGETSLFFMSPEYSVDIDNTQDLRRAEFYLRQLEKKQ